MYTLIHFTIDWTASKLRIKTVDASVGSRITIHMLPINLNPIWNWITIAFNTLFFSLKHNFSIIHVPIEICVYLFKWLVCLYSVSAIDWAVLFFFILIHVIFKGLEFLWDWSFIAWNIWLLLRCRSFCCWGLIRWCFGRSRRCYLFFLISVSIISRHILCNTPVSWTSGTHATSRFQVITALLRWSSFRSRNDRCLSSVWELARRWLRQISWYLRCLNYIFLGRVFSNYWFFLWWNFLDNIRRRWNSCTQLLFRIILFLKQV